jgi:Tol biopolymer transport system component
MQTDTRQFVRITLPVGINPANWSNPRLSPDGNTILFRNGRNLFLIALTRP